MQLGFSSATIFLIILGIFVLSDVDALGQTMRSNKDHVNVAGVSDDFDIADLDNKAWRKGEEVVVRNYWSGMRAPETRKFSARLVWSTAALYVRFEAIQKEPLVVSGEPDISRKTLGLWERDVCEIFLAPDRSEPNKYFEFEVAPTGEWIDLGIVVHPDERETDWEYKSGMTSAVRVRPDMVVMAIRVPWPAFGKTPKNGDVWLGNLFRCVGSGESRGYLSWRATETAEPSFHVPSKFGEFRFVDEAKK